MTAPLPPPTVELRDARIRLRPWRASDAPELHAAVRESIAHIGRWLPWCTADYNLADARAWITHCDEQWRNGESFAFAVHRADDGMLLGSCGLSRLDRVHRGGNLGYWVRASGLRQGVATAAARCVARFGFENLGLIRIEVVTLPDNVASRAVALRLGARVEAIARHRVWAWGAAHDAVVHSLIATDLSAGAAGDHPPATNPG